jgi:arginyl-tRNA synthetase
MVSLVRDGEAVIGGKRKGNVIELKEDLIEEIGKDAARFYFLLNSYETPATVDVELAKKQSNENPVYYVQYAHARLSNILRRAEEMEVLRQPASETDRALLTEQAELDVLRKLQDYPDEIAAAARDFAPHRLTRYAMELGSLLNVFYETCRVLPSMEAPQPVELTLVRLALVNSARIVLKNLLGMLGVSAPEKM